MSTSKPPQPPTQPGPSSYTRFIPREELGNFAAWSPTAFEQGPGGQSPADTGLRKPTLAERAAQEVVNRQANAQQKAELGKALRDAAAAAQGKAAGAAAPAPQPAARPAARPAASAAATAPQPGAVRPQPKRPIIGGVPGEQVAMAEEPAPQPEPEPVPAGPSVDELLREARQTSYQEGYRNGLAALESYKQTQAAQMAAYMSDQIGMLASDFHQRLEALEQQLAGRIAGVALELARQVVRADLSVNPETVVQVADEALGALLTSARHVTLRLNPEDHAMAQAQLAEVMGARGVRLVADAAMTRGGCVVESDIATVDASIEARWDRAAAALGHHAPWNGGHEAHGDTQVATLHERMAQAEDEGSEPGDAA